MATKLTYKVNGEEYTSYQAAVAAAGAHGKITRVYTPLPNWTSPDPEARARHIAAIKEKRNENK